MGKTGIDDSGCGILARDGLAFNGSLETLHFNGNHEITAKGYGEFTRVFRENRNFTLTSITHDGRKKTFPAELGMYLRLNEIGRKKYLLNENPEEDALSVLARAANLHDPIGYLYELFRMNPNILETPSVREKFFRPNRNHNSNNSSNNHHNETVLFRTKWNDCPTVMMLISCAAAVVSLVVVAATTRPPLFPDVVVMVVVVLFFGSMAAALLMLPDFDDDDFDARSVASINSLASTLDGLDEDYANGGRYNVRDYHQGSESVTPIPMEQRFQFGAPPPPPPATNVSNNNTNVHFAPHPSVTHIGTPGYEIPPEQQEAQINAVVRRPSSNRASTLGLSFHNRLEKIRSVPMNAEQLKNRLETQL